MHEHNKAWREPAAERRREGTPASPAHRGHSKAKRHGAGHSGTGALYATERRRAAESRRGGPGRLLGGLRRAPYFAACALM